jgi:hypothetical protein
MQVITSGTLALSLEAAGSTGLSAQPIATMPQRCDPCGHHGARGLVEVTAVTFGALSSSGLAARCWVAQDIKVLSIPSLRMLMILIE